MKLISKMAATEFDLPSMSKKHNFLKRHYIAAQEQWADGISHPAQRAFAHFDAFLGDHAFFRIWWDNLHQIAPGVWRSNQPSPRRIARLAKLGIRTIVNLRGPSRWGSYILEKEACAKAGIQLINHRMYSRRMPTYEELLATKALFESLQGPVLFHCKSGADRAGMCAALYQLMVLKKPATVASKQLSLRFLHIKHSKTGRLDYFFASYQTHNAKDPKPFLEWAKDDYDRGKLTSEFHSNRWYDWLIDRVLMRE